jgi:GTP-binding protein Era
VGDNMKSGFVSLIGRPNVGKSTLLNTLINAKIAITSNKAQTTRNIIQGVYNEKDTQIVFVDTPGIHKPESKLGRILNKQSFSLMRDVDAVLFVVDASTSLGSGDKYIMESLKNANAPVILVLNKIDKISDEQLLLTIEAYKDLFPFADVVPVSGLKKDNVEILIKVIKKYLKDDVKYFDDNTITSNSIYFMVSELVREKLLNLTIEEVPHSITCVTTNFEEKENIVNISVDIIVDRDSIKKIVIGKKGARLKEVGILARKDIEEMLGKKVYLELYVKTIKKWREKDKLLNELGFNELE